MDIRREDRQSAIRSTASEVAAKQREKKLEAAAKKLAEAKAKPASRFREMFHLAEPPADCNPWTSGLFPAGL